MSWFPFGTIKVRLVVTFLEVSATLDGDTLAAISADWNMLAGSVACGLHFGGLTAHLCALFF
jgi:hypothetical protein